MTPAQLAIQITQEWIAGKNIDVWVLRGLIATAIAADRIAVYEDAASVVIKWTNDKERADYDTFSAAMAIHDAIRIRAKEVTT